MAEPALAKGQPIHLPGNVTVASHPNKVTVDATSSTRYPGTPAATVAGGGSSCHLEPVTNIGTIFVRSFKKQLSEPDNYPFFL